MPTQDPRNGKPEAAPQQVSVNSKDSVQVHHVVIGVATVVLVCSFLLLAGIVIGGKFGAPHVVYETTPTDSMVDSDDTSDEPTEEDADSSDDESITGELSVTWRALKDQEEHPVNFYFRQWWESQNTEGATPTGYSAKVVGEFKTGPYEGRLLVQEGVTVDGFAETTDTYLVIEDLKSDREPIILTAYSIVEAGPFSQTSRFSTLDHASYQGVRFSDEVIPELDYEDIVSTVDGKSQFSFIGMGDSLEPINIANYPLAATLKDGTKLYADSGKFVDGFYFLPNEFMAVSADGRALWYDLTIPFYSSTLRGASAELSVIWNDGSATSGGYFKGAGGGCGFSTLTNVVADKDVPELKEGGHLATGTKEKVYISDSYQEFPLSDLYNNWKYSHKEGTVEEFAKSHPYFFYKDSLGRWVLFTGTGAMSSAECGKPVIYLYPEKTTDLTVNLAPQGGFTKSEPAYGQGWNVTASPDGTLVNKTDGKTYPYLFWEGRGGLYQSPSKYWVVAEKEVPAFLNATLAKLGLNEKETADFMEFWAPRMIGAPYYKIGFYGTGVMDSIAPMTLSQVPQTKIRILMDYLPLQKVEPSNAPVLPETPKRTGFTVIEWGGVLR
jgi:hypothetical protein